MEETQMLDCDLKDSIKQALMELINIFGDSVFSAPKQFKSGMADVFVNTINGDDAKRLRHLMNIAICDMNAYSRLKEALGKMNIIWLIT